MSHIMSSVASQVVRLNSIDANLSAPNSDIILFFENTAGDIDFMSSDILRQAFYKALDKFSIYLGYLRQRTDGGLEIAIDKDDLNMPNYLESTSGIHFADLKSASYSPSIWPDGLMTTNVIALPDQVTGEIKLLSVHIVRFKESSGVAVFASGCHAVADGTGFYAFINRWADEARALPTGNPAPDISVAFDRGVLVGDPADERSELDELDRFIYTTPSPEALAMSSLSPEQRNRMANTRVLEMTREGCLYRLSREKLERLRAEVQEITGNDTCISTNDVLSAVLSRTMAQATIACMTESLDQAGDPTDLKRLHLIGIACDIRRCLGISDLNYIGNALYSLLATHPMEIAALATTPETLAEIAVKIRDAVNNAQAPCIRALFYARDQIPEQFMIPSVTKRLYGLCTIVSNQSRFGLYDIDFGNGIADFATSRPTRVPGTISILPTRPPCKDLVVSITDKPAIIKIIGENKFWTDIAERVW